MQLYVVYKYTNNISSNKNYNNEYKIKKIKFRRL